MEREFGSRLDSFIDFTDTDDSDDASSVPVPYEYMTVCICEPENLSITMFQVPCGVFLSPDDERNQQVRT